MNRRSLLRLISSGGILSIGGCSNNQKGPNLGLGRIRVVNISDTKINFTLEFVHQNGSVDRTESDTLDPLGDDSKADEWVIYSVDIGSPSEYDYILEIVGGKSVVINGENIPLSSTSESNELCAMIQWIINDPKDDVFSSARVGSDCKKKTTNK